MKKGKFKGSISFLELMMMQESLASCALSGNKQAEEILKIWEKDSMAAIKILIERGYFDE